MALLKSILFFIVGIFMICLVSTQALAQPENPVDVQDSPVPITGLEILLLAGGALGGYKAYKNKNNDKSES
jgi:hypothetical protein